MPVLACTTLSILTHLVYFHFVFQYLKTLNSTDFFFLYGIARNVDSPTLRQVLRALAQAKENELKDATKVGELGQGNTGVLHQPPDLSVIAANLEERIDGKTEDGVNSIDSNTSTRTNYENRKTLKL